MDRGGLEQMIREILREQLGDATGGVKAIGVPQIQLTEAHRMDTGNREDRVYTHDLFSLAESPRLGCGIMEMHHTTFPWTLRYDEMDYVIEGQLEVLSGTQRVKAGPGEVLYIPKDSAISFSVPEHARFLYFVYPADWQNQQ